MYQNSDPITMRSLVNQLKVFSAPIRTMLPRKTSFFPLSRTIRIVCLGVLWGSLNLQGDFHDPFDTKDELKLEDWRSFSGDGAAQISIHQGDGMALVKVDATQDKTNIWWAVANRYVSDFIDLSLLEKPGWELRVEAKIRSSHAPRRVNLSFNTQRTTDFHSHLMEYDLPETGAWKTISLTTDGFDGRPGDRISCQIALMDWGFEQYEVEIDYLKVEVVNRANTGPDLGDPIPYRPPLPALNSFTQIIPASSAITIDSAFPDNNDSGESLSFDPTKRALLRWDLDRLQDYRVAGPAILELTTVNVEIEPSVEEELGLLRL